MNLDREVPKLTQRMVAKAVHICARVRICLADEVRQGSEMGQTCDAATPNCPNAAGIPYRDEPLQVLHQVARESVQAVNQIKV
jgi:hypothetical protein